MAITVELKNQAQYFLRGDELPSFGASDVQVWFRGVTFAGEPIAIRVSEISAMMRVPDKKLQELLDKMQGPRVIR